MSARGVNLLGVMEGDPLLIQAEQKLINQADELILLVDSSKFGNRSSLILCPLQRVHTIITDDGASDETLAALRAAGVKVEVVEARVEQRAAS